MPASPALAYPTKGGPVAGRHPGADPGGQLCVPSTLSRRARALLPERARRPHGTTHQDPRSHRPGQPGTVQRPGRAQRHHQPYRHPPGYIAWEPLLPLPEQAGDHRRAVRRVRKPRRELPAPARRAGSDGGRQDLLPGSATGRDVALPLPPSRPRAPAGKRPGAGGALPRLRPALPGQRQGDLPGLHRGRHPADERDPAGGPDPQRLDHPHLLGALSAPPSISTATSARRNCVAASTRCWRWRAGTSRRRPRMRWTGFPSGSTCRSDRAGFSPAPAGCGCRGGGRRLRYRGWRR